MELTFETIEDVINGLSESDGISFFKKMKECVILVTCEFWVPDTNGELVLSDIDGGGLPLEEVGCVLTCRHLIPKENLERIRFRRENDFGLWNAELEWVDDDRDLAIIRIVKKEKKKMIEKGPWNWPKISEEMEFEAGKKIYCIHHSFKLYYTFTEGMIAFPCKIDTDFRQDPLDQTPTCRYLGDIFREGFDTQFDDLDRELPLIQIQNLVGSEGGSGAPIFDSNGHVIGMYILNLKLFDFALPNSVLKNFILTFTKDLEDRRNQIKSKRGRKEKDKCVSESGSGKKRVKNSRSPMRKNSRSSSRSRRRAVMDGFLVCSSPSGGRSKSGMDLPGSDGGLRQSNDLYMTKICRAWENNNNCGSGLRCQLSASSLIPSSSSQPGVGPARYPTKNKSPYEEPAYRPFKAQDWSPLDDNTGFVTPTYDPLDNWDNTNLIWYSPTAATASGTGVVVSSSSSVLGKFHHLLSDNQNSTSTSSRCGTSISSPLTSLWYKTKMCRAWENNNNCPNGRRCQFAHGKEEMRPTRYPNKNKSPSEVCKTFSTVGSSLFGAKCGFVHHGAAVMQEAKPSSTITRKWEKNPTLVSSPQAWLDRHIIKEPAYRFTVQDWSPLDDSTPITKRTIKGGKKNVRKLTENS